MKRDRTYKNKKERGLIAAVLLIFLFQSYGCATLSMGTAGPNASAAKPQVEMSLADSVPYGPRAQADPEPVIHKSKSHYQTYFTEPPGKRQPKAVVKKPDPHPTEVKGRTGLSNGEFLFIISPAVFAPYLIGPATGLFIGIADVAGLVHTAATDLRQDVKSRRAYRTTQQTAIVQSGPERQSLDTAMSKSTFLK